MQRFEFLVNPFVLTYFLKLVSISYFFDRFRGDSTLALLLISTHAFLREANYSKARLGLARKFLKIILYAVSVRSKKMPRERGIHLLHDMCDGELFILEISWTLFQEGLHALTLIVSAEARMKQAALIMNTFC